MKAERCRAVGKNGKPCNATVVADGMCAWHAPSWESRRREWSVKGGQRRSKAACAAKALPEAFTSADLLRVLSGAIRGLETGEIEPGVVNAMANAARAMNAIREMTEVEARLHALEAAAGIASDRIA